MLWRLLLALRLLLLFLALLSIVNVHQSLSVTWLLSQIIAGKGHETYQIVGTEKSYFDDREECREALQHVEEFRLHFDTSQLPWR